jgi:ribonuclease Z
MVDVTFLGTGDAFSAGRRSNTALLVESADFRMLVEAGPTIAEQLAHAQVPVTEIEHLFVSHAHGDHSLGFPMIALHRRGTDIPLHIYGGHNTIAALQMLCGLVFPSVLNPRSDLIWHCLSERTPDRAQLAPGATMRSAVVPHPPGIPTLAARWDFDGCSVAFVTDTFPCDATVELARDSDLLIHEASFSAELEPDVDPSAYSHSTARQAGEVARQASCPRLALVHIGAEIGLHPDVLAEEARAGTDLEVIVPEDGEQVRL